MGSGQILGSWLWPLSLGFLRRSSRLRCLRCVDEFLIFLHPIYIYISIYRITMPVATTMSSAPSDLSLDPDQSYDNDQMIMAWIAALVAAGCPPFAVSYESTSPT